MSAEKEITDTTAREKSGMISHTVEQPMSDFEADVQKHRGIGHETEEN